MSDEQQQSSEPSTRKPGFFSRLFTAKEVAPPPEEAVATEPPEAPAEETAHPEESGEKKKGVFKRLFGSSDESAPQAEEAAEAVEKMSWFERLQSRLRKGSGSFMGAIRSAVGLSGKLDDETIERIEEILVAADVNMETTLKIVEQVRKRAKAERAEGTDQIMKCIRDTIEEIFTGHTKPFEPHHPGGPYVVMVVGVNGVGKTTTVGKMAKRCRDAGLKTMLVAGDTFRPAAIEQLEVWAKRTDSEFMKSAPGADPSGLVFDALNAAKSRGVDVVFVDTAGRLHTKTSLMQELGKVERAMKKIIPSAPHETLLVLDATTGQNAVQQVKIFGSAVPLSGLVMTKLDGTAKGGILLTIRDQFEVPITLIGVGEGVDDLRDFEPHQFVAALFGDEVTNQPAL